jgi:hypothetical protein
VETPFCVLTTAAPPLIAYNTSGKKENKLFELLYRAPQAVCFYQS